MLPSRIYTPEELRALTLPRVAAPRFSVEGKAQRVRPVGGDGNRNLGRLLARLFGRRGARRSAPGTA